MSTFNYFFSTLLGQLLLRHSTSVRSRRSKGSRNESSYTTINSFRWKFWFVLVKNDQNGWRKGDWWTSSASEEKTPQTIWWWITQGDFPNSVEDFYRKLYFEELDLVTCGIKDCFDQPGYKVYSQLEELLIKAAKRAIWRGIQVCNWFLQGRLWSSTVRSAMSPLNHQKISHPSLATCVNFHLLREH